jgi:alpha/beta superfamily hydrolase
MELFVPGPAGRLEARLDLPPEGRSPVAAAVACHPHPEHGGTLRNTVVHRTMRGLTRAGLAVLRFNFRGVEGSEGRHDGRGGEEQDASAALDWLAARHPGLPLWGAGFSFGARTISALALREERIRRLVLVGLPVRISPCEHVARLRQPALFLCGGADEFGTLADLRELLPDPPAHFRFAEIAGADHHFRTKSRELEEQVLAYARASLEP